MNEIKVKNVPIFKNRPLPVVEIFGNTIQGEGPRLRPAIFVRTGMCNLKCEGFGCTRIAPNGETIVGCDTIHAVSPKFKSTWTEYTKATDLIDKINSIADSMIAESKALGVASKPDIIVTGGEPLLHWDNQVLQDTLKYFWSRNFHITIETNASRMIEFTEDYQRALQFSMSVKLSVSGEPERKRLNFDAINNIIENSTGSYFKFVVNPETWDETSKEILNILNSTNSANTQVYLMPLGETIEKQLKNTRFVFDVCAKYGFSFTPRAHILAYDDLDGVQEPHPTKRILNMKFTHVVVKEGNGKPSKDQIDDAAMVKNAGQVFAIVATFKDDAKASILIDAKIAKDIGEHAESHGFEIHKLEEPENGEPVKPGDAINESEYGEYRLTQTAIDLLESFAASDHANVRLMGEVLKAEMQTSI